MSRRVRSNGPTAADDCDLPSGCHGNSFKSKWTLNGQITGGLSAGTLESACTSCPKFRDPSFGRFVQFPSSSGIRSVSFLSLLFCLLTFLNCVENPGGRIDTGAGHLQRLSTGSVQLGRLLSQSLLGQ